MQLYLHRSIRYKTPKIYTTVRTAKINTNFNEGKTQ